MSYYDDPTGMWDSLALAQAKIAEWENAVWAMGRNRDLTHAVLQGAHAGEIQSATFNDCPYERWSVWNWAWRTGFDLGRRINSRGRAAKALLDRINKVRAERTKWLNAVDAGTNDYEADMHNEAVAEGLGIAVEILFGPGA